MNGVQFYGWIADFYAGLKCSDVITEIAVIFRANIKLNALFRHKLGISATFYS